LLQERDEEQSKLAAVLKDMAAASTAGSKRQEKISDVCRDLKESKKKIAEIEALVAKAEKLKKHTAFFFSASHTPLSLHIPSCTTFGRAHSWECVANVNK